MASEARWTRGSGLIHPHVLCSNCGHARADACPAQAELLSDRAPGHVRRQGETVDLLEMFCHASAAGRPYRPDIVRGFAVRPGVPYLGVRGLRVGRAVDDERGRRDVADDGGPVRLSACPAFATDVLVSASSSTAVSVSGPRATPATTWAAASLMKGNPAARVAPTMPCQP